MTLLALDFGRVFFGWVALNNATRIAANSAAANTSVWDGSGNPQASQMQADYRQQVVNDLTAINCTAPGHSGRWLTSDIPNPVFANVNAGDPSSPYENGDHVTVSLTCDFTFLTPLLGNLMGNPLVIGAKSTFAVRSGPINGITTSTSGCSGAVVPALVGMTVQDARNAWYNAGFSSGTFSPASGSDTDFVTSQVTSPVATAGECIPAGSSVTVTYVAAGGLCTMPQMIGQRVNSAQSDYTTAGFTGTFTATTPPQGNYYVTSQSLVGGQQYACSTSVIVAGNG